MVVRKGEKIQRSKWHDKIIITDGYMLFVMPAHKIDINLDRLQNIDEDKAEKVIGDPYGEFKNIVKEHSLRRNERHEYVAKLANEAYSVYCSDKRLDMFRDKHVLFTLKNNDPVFPIYIFEKDQFVGMLFPIQIYSKSDQW